MYTLILLPVTLLSLQIVGMSSAQVRLLNDESNLDMVLFYNNDLPWPELDEQIVTFPSNIFSYVPDDLKSYELLCFEIIKKL